MELGALRSTLTDLKHDRDNSTAHERDLEKQLVNCQQGSTSAETPPKSVDHHLGKPSCLSSTTFCGCNPCFWQPRRFAPPSGWC